MSEFHSHFSDEINPSRVEKERRWGVVEEEEEEEEEEEGGMKE